MARALIVTTAIVIGMFVIGLTIQRQFLRGRISLPSGETMTETIVIQDGKVVGTVKEAESKKSDGEVIRMAMLSEPLPDTDNTSPFIAGMPDGESSEAGTTQIITKEIFVTDGVWHSVPLDEIQGGGPSKDGIPSIDDPKFVTVDEAVSFLPNDEIGIAVSRDGVNRFYPYQILVWHEIVNDNINGQRILVTYCPLCLSGIVFDPLVDGERVEFGTSGKLWNSNLVMYDRKTDSLWSQVLGEAIVGEMTGTRFSVLQSDIMKFGQWRELYPNGKILSRDTGAIRFYGRDPYGDYYTTPGTYFPVNARDGRLNDKDFVLGIVVQGKAKAYWTKAVKAAGRVEDEFAGKIIIAEYDSKLDVVRLFEKQSDGTLNRINPFPNFWFSWVAVHPNTELYKG